MPSEFRVEVWNDKTDELIGTLLASASEEIAEEVWHNFNRMFPTDFTAMMSENLCPVRIVTSLMAEMDDNEPGKPILLNVLYRIYGDENQPSSSVALWDSTNSETKDE